MTDSLSIEEFELWEPWPAAYTRIGRAVGWDRAKVEIRRRLVLGSVKACAREAFWDFEDRPGVERREFELLSNVLWGSGRAPKDHSNVWQTGSFDFGIAQGYRTLNTQFNGIRLDPVGLDLLLSDAGCAKPVVTTASAIKTTGETQPERKAIAKGEAERFARAILHGWPDATEEFAHTKALAFYPENRVPRDWFRGVFRVIRGPKKRGPREKIPG